MGIGSGQARLLQIVASLSHGGRGRTSVCEYGAQVPLVAELSVLTGHNGASGIKTAEDLYRALGFTTYVTFDINGEYGAQVFDINNDVVAVYGYTETFDLVTNFGTSEHCFNQYQVFRNIHNSCKAGGLMLHTVPAQGWGQHCFFRYDGTFFRDLSEANGYEIVHLAPFLRLKSFQANAAAGLDDIERTCRFIAEKLNSKNFEGDDPYYDAESIHTAIRGIGLGPSLFNVTIGCVLRKSKDSAFVTPIQGMYRLA